MKRTLAVLILAVVGLAGGCAFQTGDGQTHVVKYPGVDYVLCGVPAGCDRGGFHYQPGDWVYMPEPTTTTTTAPPLDVPQCLIPEGCNG